MGCSASRSNAFISTDQQQNSQPSSFSSSRFQSPSSTPVSRTLSLPNPLVHHPPLCKGDTNHLVSLTSTTYGSLVLIDNPPKPNLNGQAFRHSTAKVLKVQDLGDSSHPLSPDSIINTWELMEGLDDLDYDVIQSPVRYPKKAILYSKSKTSDYGSMSNDFDATELLTSYEFVEHSDSKPLWQHLSEESLLAKLDPDVVSSYRRALLTKQCGGKEANEWLPEPKAIQSIKWVNSTEPKSIESIKSNNLSESKAVHSIKSSNSSTPAEEFYLSGAEDRIVLYYTSLRGIRKTYEECCSVRMIFGGFRVWVDERDMSMDSSYRMELQSALRGKTVSLPQIFIRGKYTGGGEEIKQLHETGELAKLLEGIPMKNFGLSCEGCGDARFVPCPNCNGSQKIFEEDEGRMRRCSDCNENGLIRCPNCCP